MRLEPLYRATWTTPEAYHVDLTGDAGSEGRSFFIAEGRTEGASRPGSEPRTIRAVVSTER
ncbi:MAG: hypothetical protein L0206_15330 [Actinobacteria bacterium]|nr:hypothetical protein [Actinomycetota bacterium]